METTGNAGVYIVHLEVAMAVFDLLLCLFLRVQKRDRTEVNRRFAEVVYCLTAGTIVDVITSLLNNHRATVSPLLLRPMRALNGLLGVFLCLVLFRYVLALLNITLNQVQRAAAAIPFVASIALWIMNPVAGVIHRYHADGVMESGPLFMVAYYYLPLLYLFVCCLLTFIYHRRFERVQLLALCCNLAFIILLFFVQMFFVPYLMITYYVGSVAVYTMFFSLETPAYDRLIETMEELEDALATADGSAMKAITASRSKSLFLAGMSEEMRAPVMSILKEADNILETTSDSTILRYARGSREAVEHLRTIVDDILVYSRIESGREGITIKPFETRALLDKISAYAYQAVREKGLKLSVMAGENLPAAVEGDLPHILQVLNNLVSNAIKYTNHGTVGIAVRMHPQEGQQERMEISVSDTGVGIRAEDIPYLFDSFARMDLRENKQIAGTGLGLAITKCLIDLMKGEIRVESTPGKGSVFTVILPVTVTDATPVGGYDTAPLFAHLDRGSRGESDSDTQSLRGRLEGKKILIIDDTAVNPALMKSLLQDTGAQIDTGRDAAACLKMAAATAYDLILLDQMMPGIDGVEAFARMRERRETDPGFASVQTPVIMTVTEDTKELREALRAKGFAATLGKPVDADAFLDTMRRFLLSE